MVLHGEAASFRATLEDCINSQETLRHLVDGLKENGSYITDEKEREKIIVLFAHSCLGTDIRRGFDTVICKKHIKWSSLGYAIRRVSYWDGTNDEELNGLDVKMVWHMIRDELFSVFSLAQNLAFTHSPVGGGELLGGVRGRE